MAVPSLKIYFTYNSLLRTKTDDPEKEKMKAKVRELHRSESEQKRQQDANTAALAAIAAGPKNKKFRVAQELVMKPGTRVGTKRVHLSDMLFLMEQEKDLIASRVLFRSYK